MAAKKEFPRCQYCGRNSMLDDPEDGFKVIVTANGGHRTSCPCGVMTKIFPTKLHLQACLRSKPGKIVDVPKITVKHSLTNHVDPKLMSHEPDEF